jgi:hypothetical protein
MKRALCVLVFVLAALSCAVTVHARSTDMPRIRNETILSTPGPEAEKIVQAAIIRGARQKSWQVVQKEPRKLRLKLRVRGKHTIVVDVHINIDMVDVEYVSSINMNYEKSGDGRERIHPHYEKWVRMMLDAARAATGRIKP